MHSAKIYNTLMGLKIGACWCKEENFRHTKACLKAQDTINELTKGMCKCTVKKSMGAYTFDYECLLFVIAKNPDLMGSLTCPKCGKPVYMIGAENVQE